MIQSLFRIVFWLGYTAVLITSGLNFNWHLDQIKVHAITFDLRLDHLLHFGVYFLICLYFLLGKRFGTKLFENRSLPKFLFFVLFLASVTEIIQIWVPERAFNVMDWVANVTGIILGTILIKIKDSRRKIQEKKQF